MLLFVFQIMLYEQEHYIILKTMLLHKLAMQSWVEMKHGSPLLVLSFLIPEHARDLAAWNRSIVFPLNAHSMARSVEHLKRSQSAIHSTYNTLNMCIICIIIGQRWGDHGAEGREDRSGIIGGPLWLCDSSESPSGPAERHHTGKMSWLAGRHLWEAHCRGEINNSC